MACFLFFVIAGVGGRPMKQKKKKKRGGGAVRCFALLRFPLYLCACVLERKTEEGGETETRAKRNAALACPSRALAFAAFTRCWQISFGIVANVYAWRLA